MKACARIVAEQTPLPLRTGPHSTATTVQLVGSGRFDCLVAVGAAVGVRS